MDFAVLSRVSQPRVHRPSPPLLIEVAEGMGHLESVSNGAGRIRYL